MRLRGRRSIAAVVALAAALSAIGLSQAAAALAEPTPTLAPPAGQTAVHGGQQVIFGGSVPAGSTLVSAGLRFLDVEGDRVPIPEENLGDMPVEPRTFISAEGKVTGDMTLPGLPPELNDGTVHLVLRIEKDGEQATGISNGVTIDLQRPYILRTELVAPRQIKVYFSEKVRLPAPLSDEKLNEQLANWRICNQPGCSPSGDVASNGVFFPIQVNGEGATRTLELSPLHELDEDATPKVWFNVAPKTAYEDGARWTLDANGRLRVSIDRIAPKLPTVTEVAGRTGESVTANDPTPRVVLSGLRPGHVGQAYRETEASPNGFQVGADALLGEAVANAQGQAVVNIADEYRLPADGTFVLYGVARDRAKCDPSNEASPECPNHSDGVARNYLLDTVVPTPVFAASDLRDGVDTDPIVRVRFSEPVSPAGDAGTWEIVMPGVVIEGVSGSGDERILDVNMKVPGEVLVKWTAPSATNAALLLGDGEVGYSDDAGNAVESFQRAIVNGIPPVATVTSPPNHTIWVKSDRINIVGETEGATDVLICGLDGCDQVFRHESQFGQDRWGFSHQKCLGPCAVAAHDKNGSYTFTVKPRRDVQGDGVYEAQGADQTVPSCAGCSVILDTRPPVVGVAPLGRTLADGSIGFKGREPITITWEATDANFGSTPIKVEFFDGRNWETLGGGLIGNFPSSLEWLAPAINTENAKVRVTATDQAQWRTIAESNTFVIDSRPPNFSAAMHNATRVDVLFDEPVQTSSNPAQAAEWWIQDVDPVTGAARKVPAGAAQPIPGQSGMIIGLRLTTGLVNGVPQQLDPNARPVVSYEAPDQNEELVEQVKDRAGNLLATTEEIAQDLVKPLGPSGASARALSRAQSETVSGQVPQADARNEIVARRMSPGAEFLGQVAGNGTYSVAVGLVRDRAATYEVRVRDEAGNISGDAALITITNDSTAPKVSVKKPGVRRSGSRRYITVKWASVEPHKGSVTIQFRLKGSSKWARQLRTVVKNTADDGSFVWRAPSWVRGRQIKYYVAAVDQVGNARQAASRYYSVR